MKLSLSPRLAAVAPGEEAVFEVTIGNDGDLDLAPTLTINGFDPQQIVLPEELPVLDPGQVATVAVRVRVPQDATAGGRRIGFTITDPDGSHRAVAVTATLEVGTRPDVAVEVSPASSEGRRGATVQTLLHNRSTEPIHVYLAGEGEGIEVSFYVSEVTLDPGEDLPVPTRFERVQRSWFREVRHGALVSVRSGGAPVTGTATFTQRPAIPPVALKVVAFIMVLALWATAVVAITTRLQADDVPLAKFFVTPDFGAGGRSTVEAEGVGFDTEATVQGAVEGPSDPEGTEVVIERVVFGDQGTTDPDDGPTRVAAMTPVSLPLGQVIERIETTTDERGAFRFADGLAAPAFYRVTAFRPGFEVASQVVSPTEDEPDVELAIVLEPADGAMSGRVTDTSGNPLGGADITITDGNLVFSATSATEDGVGSWSVAGLATPKTYEVIVQQRGYATATLAVDLEGGEQLGEVDVQLEGGLGTIRGRVTHRGEGVGGVHIALVGNPTERETTTLTDGDLAGTFDFPALNFGTYQLTFSAPGWLTQTTEVVVDQGDVPIEVSDLRPSTAVVQGVVTQAVAPGGGCRYPDPEFPEQRDGAVQAPCGGVGVTLIGEETTLRTTSATGDGSFQLSGVPGGEFLVRFERFGYVSRFYEISAEPGDILTLPGDASVTTPPDDPQVALAQTHEGPDTIQMELTPAVPDDAGEIQAVIRDSTDPSAVFEPPAGTSITVDGQPGAVVEELSDGAVLISGLAAGAATVRIDAPGYDMRTEVVRVSSSEVSDAGIIDITPLGSLALRITGGQSAVVGDAEVFVVPDPAVYGPDGRTPPRLEDLDDDVSTCTRGFDLDDRAWNLEGLCARTDAVGDVEFTRSFGTGNYVMVTPTNPEDAADDARFRATTVPLDHERLVRRVDIDSGATTRLDPNLRRYAIVQGAVRSPSSVDEGLDPEDVERSDITFERVDADGNVLQLPDGAPTPRVSGNADQGSTLGRGQYRIDRIPADDGQTQYEWRMVISTSVGTFTRGPGQPEGYEAISGLQFNETRTINAILQPDPEELTFELRYQSANEADAGSPVPGALLRVRGTSVFEQLEQAPFFRPTFTTCPGSGCAVPGEFDFGWVDDDGNLVGDPRVVRSTAFTGDLDTQPEDDLWLTADGATPTGDLTIPAFFRPGPIRYEIYAPGFEPVELPPNEESSFELETPEEGADTPPIMEELTPQERPFTGQVVLDPAVAAADYPAFLAVPPFEITQDSDILEDLSVALTIKGGDNDGDPVTLVDYQDDGSFDFGDVLPGTYELSISGPRVEDVAREIVVAPADAAFTVSTVDATVDRLGIIRGAVTAFQTDVTGELTTSREPLAGAEVALQRFDFSALSPVTDEVLQTCVDSVSDPDPDCDDDGVVTFEDLSLFEESSFFNPQGLTYYRLQVTRPDYAPLETTYVALADDPYPDLSLEPDRFGEVRGTVEGQIGARDPELLAGATVRVLRAGTSTEVARTQTGDGTGDPLGEFRLGPDANIPPGSYDLEFSKDGYVTTLAADLSPVPTGLADIFAYNTQIDIAAVIPALPVDLYGEVRSPDGRQMYHVPDPLGGPGNGVRVTIELEPTDPLPADGGTTPTPDETGPARAVTLSDGQPITLDAGGYLIAGFDAGIYTVRFVPDPATPGGDDFDTREVTDVEVLPGDALELDALLPFQDDILLGTVTERAFADDALPEGPLAGVTVTATGTDAGNLGQTYETETDASGMYGFDTIAPGTYDLTFELDGYTSASSPAVLVQGPLGATVWPQTVEDARLEPELVDVEVDVTSLADGITDPLDGAEVVATYLGPEVAAAPPQDGTSVIITSGDPATFTLPPGNWRFAVDNTADVAFSPRPHVPGSIDPADPGGADFNVPIAVEGITTPVAFDLQLAPYRSISGTVEREVGSTFEPADGVALDVVDGSDPPVTVTSPGALVDPVVETGTPVATVTWKVWLPTIPAAGETDPGAQRSARFQLVDYNDALFELTDALFPNDELDVVVNDPVRLFSNTREVTYTLSSVVDGVDLSSMRLRATASGETDVTVDVVEDAGDFTATFGGLDTEADWTITTLDGDTVAVPHLDVSVPLTFSEDAGPQDESIMWEGEVTGTVSGRRIDDAAAAVTDLAGADITVRPGVDTNGTPPEPDDPVVRAVSAADGSWTVAVLVQEEGRVDVDATGYEGVTDLIFGGNGGPRNPFDNDVADVGEATLDALTRPVELTIRSSDTDDGSLAGLTAADITATATFAGVATDPVLTPTSLSFSSDDRVATATFDALAPNDDWTITVDTGDITQTHADGSVENLEVPLWDEVAPRQVDAGTLTLDRLVEVSGTLTPRAYDDGPAITTTPTGLDATVTGPSLDGAVTFGTAAGDGAIPWSFDAIRTGSTTDIEVTFDADDYTTSDTLTIVGTDWNGDVGTGNEVDLVAEPVEVDVRVSSSDTTIGALNDVVVTAVFDDDTFSPQPTGTLTGTSGAATGGNDGELTLTLPPGAWTLETSDADTATDAAGTTEPHADTTQSLSLSVGDTFGPPVDLELDPFVEVSGTVAPVEFDGGASIETFENRTITATNAQTTATYVGTVDALADDGGGNIATDADWRIKLPPSDDWDVTINADGFAPDVFSQTVTTSDVSGVSRVIEAAPIEVTVTVRSTDTNLTPRELQGVTVTATFDGDPAPAQSPLTAESPTDAAGQTTLHLAPGDWDLTTTGAVDATSGGNAAAHYDAVTNPEASTDEVPPVAVTVAFDQGTAVQTIDLNPNSVLFGAVFEERGNDRIAISGVTIRANDGEQTFATVSTEPDENGENFRLRARSGTFEITAERDGEVTVVDDAFEIIKDGPDTERNYLEIVLPTTTIDVSGQVVGESGAGVTGASIVATSAVGTVTTTTDEDGRYTLDGLDNRQTWSVTFSPPDGVDAKPVTRYLALSGDTTVELALDQTLPTALGDIDLHITGGEPGQQVAVSLSESTPFPTLHAEGRLDRTVQLAGDGTAVVAFEDLVPGDGNTLPQNRFTLDIHPAGQEPVTRGSLDVTPGGTTVVEVDLGQVGVLTKQIELTLTADDVDVTDADVRLQQDALVLGPPVSAADSNVYTFGSVQPGTWTVLADGYEDASIDVPMDDSEVFRTSLSLVPLPDEDDAVAPQTEEGVDGESEPDDTGGDTTDGGTTSETTDGGTIGDETGDDNDNSDGTADDPATGTDEGVTDGGSDPTVDTQSDEAGSGGSPGDADTGDGSGPDVPDTSDDPEASPEDDAA